MSDWAHAHHDHGLKDNSFVKEIASSEEFANPSCYFRYHRNSLVLVGQEHAYFASDFARKPKRRFGRVVRSNKNTITEMLLEHKKDVFGLLLDDVDAWREDKPSDDMDLMPVLPSPKTLPHAALLSANAEVPINGNRSPQRSTH